MRLHMPSYPHRLHVRRVARVGLALGVYGAKSLRGGNSLAPSIGGHTKVLAISDQHHPHERQTRSRGGHRVPCRFLSL